MPKNRELTYSLALKELEKIVNEIESEELDIDILAEKIRRGSQLIIFCKGKLRTAEDEVTKVLSEMKDEADSVNTEKE